ncbi:N-acetyldiaminopimelate deacetylase [Bacillus carboniphilus]|uniref:N-acetyldiaminopimelate deacetylase n=1 Tax=Bacillus carboniphilus TaxID=86663 RepID=A0ABY9JXX3_9BACI|nr:N-acetyldiaminopimelate deacetylase [Bacillus carboniphilus]WLR44244.1 N-acetyldiaminopimelate deacetylase [Bacillus carboniphilus]
MIDLIKTRRDLHQIPELGFKEYKTQQYIIKYLESLNCNRLEIKKWETGLFVMLKGINPVKTLAYRADMDGLPIKEQTGLPFQSIHENNMHACGHDFHMTIALGLIQHFVDNPINDHLLFIFQPAEEGPGGAKPMVQSSIMKEWKPDMITALHIAPEYPVGTIATKPGLLFANTSELFITLLGKGGHAAYPHHTNDMVVAACSLVNHLQTIVSRNIDPLDSAVVTIGKITGGTVQNIIAEQARLEGTIRTLSATSMSKIKERIEQLTKGLQIGLNCTIEIDYGSNYYQVFNNERLVNEFIQFSKSTKIEVVECQEAMTGEDFGFMLKEIPGFMFWLGVDSQYGLHHANLAPNEKALEVAVEHLSRYLTWKGNLS